MTVWIYVDTTKQVGDKDHLRVFANSDAAETWFEENDPEGVAFEYEVLGTEGGQGTLDVRALFAPRRRAKLTAPSLPPFGGRFLLRVQSQLFGLQLCD